MNRPQTYSGQVFMMDEVCLFAITIIPWLSPIRKFWGCVFPMDALLQKLSSKESRMETKGRCFPRAWWGVRRIFWFHLFSNLVYWKKAHAINGSLSLSSNLSLARPFAFVCMGSGSKSKSGSAYKCKNHFCTTWFRVPDVPPNLANLIDELAHWCL